MCRNSPNNIKESDAVKRHLKKVQRSCFQSLPNTRRDSAEDVSQWLYNKKQS